MDSRNGKIMEMLWILINIEIRQSWTHNLTGGCVRYPSSHDNGSENASLNSSYLSDVAILHFHD